jgi:hypothetical protein
MLKAALLGVLLISTAVLSSAQDIVIWQRVEGIIQPGGAVGSGTGAVPGGILPWTTTAGVVQANLSSGQLSFIVRGLSLAAGNVIGTRGDITAVRGVLVCDTNGSAGGGNSTLVQTPAVPLSLVGNAFFSGDLGSIPAVCRSEPDLAFLIRIAAIGGAPVTGPWIAAGAVRRD